MATVGLVSMMTFMIYLLFTLRDVQLVFFDEVLFDFDMIWIQLFHLFDFLLFLLKFAGELLVGSDEV